ncbi:2-succinyl-5-enolpyruvyl-6-hydroxy-3-cyclohexene-1-carboxylic-acid synthase [Herbiconiux moechotypicola]|uniref:2-succinyl-5-enolpyruvyl-6-hydroxy-3-cyclohexene-1-carboxylate synthase n=1 Tax=Herbiconiux moechotypicola TaxID=637393 RepID=A0ABP5QZQ3_9MICO|nr:2-succinyl-5-enolpyruvyl-6-hydroxy-3-cyclohexene-1-carboxylic-acid synthase [Herbiconiux moechotypicola]MCS5731111.1 2-succinyl-5-enolpyruvyl-6-hydroxy-3-cyclohexene-1-carboxylic-acid synthase [Herbiconiux moechotypicola]
MTVSPATTFAHRLAAELVERGVEHAVVSPGSRSQALALELARLETQGRIRLHVRIDERVAAFTALGIARESGRPALVVTTSGTAVANLVPAVVEAHHSGVPMIVLTADRPESLRGTGSNQTTVQPGIFGVFAVAEVDVPAPTAQGIPDAGALAEWAVAEATGGSGRPAGAVHLNLQFAEPLSGSVDPSIATVPWAAPVAAVPSDGAIARLEAGPRTIVIAGADAGEVAEETARRAGLPLVAEVSSGARFGPLLVGSYRELLAHPEFGGEVERAIVFGHPTLSREVPAVLGRPGVEVLVVAGRGAPFLPAGARAVAGVDVSGLDPRDPQARSWTNRWVLTGRGLLDEADAEDDVDAPVVSDSGTGDVDASRAFARGELAALNAPVTRRSLVRAAWRASWPHDRLVIGASRLIRVLDQAAAGKRIPVHANRGLAGIDGTVSTALGIAAAAAGSGARRVGTTRVLLGDLALLHDAGALARTPGEPVPRVQLVVGNDGGGTIFDGLEVAGTAEREAFDRVLYTPQAVDLAALAAAYGWEHRQVTRRGELDSALASPAPGCSIVEVTLER